MTWEMIIQFLVLTAIVSGAIIFTLHRVFVSSVEGAKQRLEKDAEAARAREAELNRKIRQADEELAQRKKELDALEQKMKGELEAEAEKHREELVNKARTDAEEIITKAQNAAEGIRRDIEKQMEIKIVGHAAEILSEILSKKAGEALEKDLTEEYIAQLKSVDMSKISLEIKAADVVTVHGLSEEALRRIQAAVWERTGREIALHPKTEAQNICGVVLRFGSLHLDGSLNAGIREAAIALKAKVEKAYQDKK